MLKPLKKFNYLSLKKKSKTSTFRNLFLLIGISLIFHSVHLFADSNVILIILF